MKVNRWWIARRLIGKSVFMNVGKLKHVDWWDLDAYTDEDMVGGPFYITIPTFIKAIFSRPRMERNPWKIL